MLSIVYSSAYHKYCPVIGFSEDTTTQTLDEGEASMLIVQVLKPAIGVGQRQFVNYLINNSANIGK